VLLKLKYIHNLKNTKMKSVIIFLSFLFAFNLSAQSPLVYTAILTQADTNYPHVIVLENTLGGEVVWTREDIGVYMATLTDAFTIGKTVFPLGYVQYISPPFADDFIGTPGTSYVDDDIVYYQTQSGSGVISDNILNGTLIKIEVYP
jgi:hypothetical protein